MFDTLRKVVNPQTNVVEGRNMNLGWLFSIKGSHDIDLNLTKDTLTTLEDIFINIFSLGFEGIDLGQTQGVHPELLQVTLAQAPQSNLLQTQNVEWSLLKQ